MFTSVGWELMEDANKAPCVRSPSGKELRILKRNEFDHARTTMSVIVQDKEDRLHVYCKVSCWRIINDLQCNSGPYSIVIAALLTHVVIPQDIPKRRRSCKRWFPFCK